MLDALLFYLDVALDATYTLEKKHNNSMYNAINRIHSFGCSGLFIWIIDQYQHMLLNTQAQYLGWMPYFYLDVALDATHTLEKKHNNSMYNAINRIHSFGCSGLFI